MAAPISLLILTGLSLFRIYSRYLAMRELENAKKQYLNCLQSGTDNCMGSKIIADAFEGLENAQVNRSKLKPTATSSTYKSEAMPRSFKNATRNSLWCTHCQTFRGS